jgi:multidrug resistance efflux pump
MEILITIAYFFLVRLIFFDYKLLKLNLFWKFIVFGFWICALLTEIIMLGQFAPHSNEAFVQAYVVQMAPDYGGLVKEVYVQANTPVKKGDPLFQMDPEHWQYKVDRSVAQLAAAGTSVAELAQQLKQADAQVSLFASNLEVQKLIYRQIKEAASQSAASLLRLETVQKQVLSLEAELRGAKAAQQAAQIALDSSVGDQPTAVAEALAELGIARYNLEYTTIRAPSNGYVSNMQLHPGGFTRLKKPVMTFISTDEYWIVAKTLQQGIKRIAPGDSAELAFDMYPGKVFGGVVESIVWASGNAQGEPTGRLPTEQEIQPAREFFVRLRLIEEDSRYPLRFGASGIVVIYTRTCPGFLKILRQIEIQSESYLNYLFNPF